MVGYQQPNRGHPLITRLNRWVSRVSRRQFCLELRNGPSLVTLPVVKGQHVFLYVRETMLGNVAAKLEARVQQ